MANIKETREILALVKELPNEIAAVMADGKVDWKDLPKLATLWTPAKAAFEGVDQVPAELGDLDAAEIQALVADAIAVGQAWVALVSALVNKAA